MGLVPQFWGHETPKTPQQKNWHETWTSNLWKGKSFEPNLHDFEIHVSFWGCINDHPLFPSHRRGCWSPGTTKNTQTIKLSTPKRGSRGEDKEWQFLWLQWLCRWSELELWHLRCFWWRWWRRGNWCRLRPGVEKFRVWVPGREEMRKKKVPCCAFFVWVRFVGQEDLHTVSLVETQSCWVSLLSKTFDMLFICSNDLQKLNRSGFSLRFIYDRLFFLHQETPNKTPTKTKNHHRSIPQHTKPTGQQPKRAEASPQHTKPAQQQPKTTKNIPAVYQSTKHQTGKLKLNPSKKDPSTKQPKKYIYHTPKSESAVCFSKVLV